MSVNIEYKGKDDFDHDKYVLSDGQGIIGFITVDLEMRAIMNVFVKEELRGKGYGTALVRHVQSLFISKGFTSINTSPINPEARGFFEKLCFAIDNQEFGLKKLLTEK